VAQASRWSSRWLPHGWFDAVRQLALYATAYYLYRLVRGLVDGQITAAYDHAREVVNLERGLHLFFEPAVQAWALGQAWLVKGADLLYVYSHFAITTGFLVWLYFARNDAYAYVRNMFMIAMVLALMGYVAFPTAPPRFLPEWGFQDTVSNLFGESATASAGVLYNPFAAMPSMHVAFALMVGLPAAMLVRQRLLRALWALYPLLVSFVVIVTANHFWLDGAAGVLVAAGSAYAAHAGLARARPGAWSWAGAGAAA
jgi:membrane-associated phospholipid phosphatase